MTTSINSDSSSSNAAPAAPASSSPMSFQDSVGMMAYCMSMLTGVLENNSAQISEDNISNQQLMMQQTQNQLTQQQQNLQKDDKASQKHGIFHSIASHDKILIKAAVCCVAIGLGQEWLAAAIIGTSIAKELSGPISNEVTQICEDCGMSPDAAALVGSIVGTTVILSAAIASAAVGDEMGDEKVVKESASDIAQLTDEGTELTDLSSEAEEATMLESGSSSAQMNSQEAAQRITSSTSGKIEKEAEKTISDTTKKLLKSAVYGLAQGWQKTGMTEDILKVSGNDSKTTEIWANALTDVITAAASIAVVATSMPNPSEVQNMSASSFDLLKLSSRIKRSARLIEAVSQAGQAYYEVKIGKLSVNNANIQSDLATLQQALKAISEREKANIKTTTNLVTTDFKSINMDYDSLNKAMTSITEAIAS